MLHEWEQWIVHEVCEENCGIRSMISGSEDANASSTAHAGLHAAAFSSSLKSSSQKQLEYATRYKYWLVNLLFSEYRRSRRLRECSSLSYSRVWATALDGEVMKFRGYYFRLWIHLHNSSFILILKSAKRW